MSPKQYYYAIDNVQHGPVPIDELFSLGLTQSSLVWSEGMSDWAPIKDVGEIQYYIVKHKKSLPIAPEENKQPPPIVTPTERIDYTKVEDIARVDYKRPMIMTGIFLFFYVISYNWLHSTFLGVFAFLIWPLLIFSYFKKFLVNVGDRNVAKFINALYVSHGVFFISFLIGQYLNADTETQQIAFFEYIFILLNDVFSDEAYSGPIPEHISQILGLIIMTFLSFLIAAIFMIIAGVKLISADNRYDFPLKRMAWSFIIILPLFMINSIGYTGEAPRLLVRIFLAIPFILLFIHFFQADQLDATP